MTLADLYPYLGKAIVAAPLVPMAVVGISALVGYKLAERTIARYTQVAVIAGLAMLLVVLGLMLYTGDRHIAVELGNWVVLPHYHFRLQFEFDRLSIPFAILSYTLVGIIGAFANQYLHREPGYRRFFFLYAVFLAGMIIASLAGTIETLFLGWELVGLSSALLVAYFQDRKAPVINGQRVWSVYRVSDAAFLIAAVTLHHLTGEGNFNLLMGHGAWPEGRLPLDFSPGDALFVGLLLLVAAAGKSALIPFSGWLPRAMEGPTPSSAIFYGALSVHLGSFLLLRVSPILDASLILSAAVVVLGLSTAVFAALAARVQTDVKSALAFASLTQVGIITAEIGFGFRYIALIHIIGHACLRTLQLLRAPTLLHDYHNLENAVGAHLAHASNPFSDPWLPGRARLSLYRISFERGYLDAALNEYIVRPFVRLFRWCDGMERRWMNILSGTRRQSVQRPALSVQPDERCNPDDR